MSKRSVLFLILFSISYSQEIIGEGLSGQPLLDYVVHNYKTATTLGYNTARDTLYSKIDLQEGNQLSCVYSGYTITLDTTQDPSTDAYNQGINCEHTYPQSMGASEEPQKSDMHHLFPCKSNVNSSRGNDPYAEIPDGNTDTWYRNDYSQNTIPTEYIDEFAEKDNPPNPNNEVFEPKENHKGDASRAMFYFFAMYNDVADTNFWNEQKDVLLDWHYYDEVDDWELNRNWAIASYQENQPNPFILDSSLARRIWYMDDGGTDTSSTDTTVYNIIINEIMQNPSAVGDSEGEWFEIYNNSDEEIDLDGFTIKDNDTDLHLMTEETIVAPYSFAVLGRNDDTTVNGGVILNYEYSDISLANGADEILLVDPYGNTVDSVAYDGGSAFPDPNGASMALVHPDSNNNVGTNWQESTTSYGDGDLGTPGIPNISSDISIDLTPLDFDTVFVNESGTLDLTITNNGNAPLQIDSLYTSSDLFTLSIDNSLIETSAILSITYTPVEFGPDTGTAYIKSNDPDEGLVQISLSGFGYYPSPDIELSANSINFGGVMDGLTGTQLLHVYNTGDLALELDTMYCTGNFSVIPGSGTVDASDNLALEVIFAPDDEASFEGMLTIVAGNDPDEDTLTVSLSGNGTQQAPIMELSDNSLYFGVVVAGQTVTRQTTIYNTGMHDLEVEEITMAGSELFTTDFSDATVEPGDSVDVVFQFAPTEQIIEATATATILASGDANQTVTLEAGYFGPVWYIATNGSDETGDGTLEHPFETIQKGVNASAGGDTVLVSEGTYIGNISINKEINLIGEHPVSTMLDGNNDGYIITIEEQTNQNININNFTLKNGNGGITNHSQSGNLKISNTILHNNNQYTISHSSSDSLLLSNVTVSNNANGGGVVIGTLGNGHLDIKNSIIYNEPDQGILLGDYATATASIQYSNILGGESSIITNVGEGDTYEWGDGNIDIDPLFCGVDDYSLAENSPAVGSGEDGTDMGALGIGCEAISPSRIYVGTTGSDETGNGTENNPFATIQKGVDESDEGDTVLVDSGTYFEFVDISDKRITLSSHLSLYPDSLDLISNTIISGISNDFGVINISYDVDSDDLVYPLGVKGFTISNGVGFGCEFGEGIMFSSSNTPLIVQNCVMISNDEDNCNISSRGDVIINKVTMRKLAIVGDPSWHVIANNSIIYGGILELGVDSPNIYDISYSLLPSFWEGEGNIVADPLFCDSMNGDFLLAENSPAVGSGENGTNMGALGIGCEAIDLNLSEIYQIPSDYALHQNYPNPFNPTTQIRYDLPEDQFVSVTIYNVMGHKIRTLINLNQSASYHSIKWDAKNDIGEGVSAGMYIYVIQAGEFKATKKMLLLK